MAQAWFYHHSAEDESVICEQCVEHNYKNVSFFPRLWLLIYAEHNSTAHTSLVPMEFQYSGADYWFMFKPLYAALG